MDPKNQSAEDLKLWLMRSETMLKMILDLIPLSIYARYENGDYIFGNHVFLNHYGITAEDLKNKNLRDYVRSPEEFEILTMQDQHVITSGEKLFVSEFKQADHEGMIKSWRIIKVPFTFEGQERKAILGIAENITERKKYEEEIIDMSNTIAARNRDLEKFSFLVSHELRGPLTNIMGFSELVDNMHLEQADISTFLAGIKDFLTKLDTIIRVLNDLIEPKA
jgi:PAS domain S-box-containing protein